MKDLDVKMRMLIVDRVMLVYLHDLLSLREHRADQFHQSDVYEILHEKTFTTVILGFKKTFGLLALFLLFTFGLKQLYLNLPPMWQWIGIVLLVLVYGIGFIIGKKEWQAIEYQLRLKAACQYALAHYNYQEFVIFLDQYLSVQSTELYYQST